MAQPASAEGGGTHARAPAGGRSRTPSRWETADATAGRTGPPGRFGADPVRSAARTTGGSATAARQARDSTSVRSCEAARAAANAGRPESRSRSTPTATAADSPQARGPADPAPSAAAGSEAAGH